MNKFTHKTAAGNTDTRSTKHAYTHVIVLTVGNADALRVSYPNDTRINGWVAKRDTVTSWHKSQQNAEKALRQWSLPCFAGWVATVEAINNGVRA